ncbi:hypothetical protein [uncultured Sphingomonas sp.]|uniref:hypothetical protein n=1 Tax=uncultured Sphingomonas sp. TaxID=158754 RepID=UPI0025FB0B08|nr:hypothetical protein [uncultured Sphingomonas sp.]
MVEEWGTARERQRQRRRRTLMIMAIVTAALAPLLAVFLLGLVEGFSGAYDPDRAIQTRSHAGYIATAIALLVVLVVKYRMWRSSDEVERQQVTAALAMAGIVALASLPVLSLAEQPLGFKFPALIGWAIAIAALVTTRIVQRLRG